MHFLQEPFRTPERPAPLDEASVRAVLAELAQDAQYQPPQRDLDEQFWLQLAQWLFGDRGLGAYDLREGLSWIAYVLGAALLLVLLVVVWRIVRASRRARDAEAKPQHRTGAARASVDPFDEAERAWAAGDGRAAVSALYLGAVQSLDARGLVRAEASKLASVYRAELGAAPERNLWDRVVAPFYAAVFGGRPVLPDEFDAARRAARELAAGRAAGGPP